MLVENSFPEDPRVRREAVTLVNAGYKVCVIALRMKGIRSAKQTKGVTVYRIRQIEFFKKTVTSKFRVGKLLQRVRTMLGYVLEYFYFTVGCVVVSLYVLVRHGFDVVHVHNPPNILFLVGAFYKLFNKQFIFDNHDLEPELFLTKFGAKRSLVYRTLIVIERICLNLADMVIATNESY